MTTGIVVMALVWMSFCQGRRDTDQLVAPGALFAIPVAPSWTLPKRTYTSTMQCSFRMEPARSLQQRRVMPVVRSDLGYPVGYARGPPHCR